MVKSVYQLCRNSSVKKKKCSNCVGLAKLKIVYHLYRRGSVEDCVTQVSAPQSSCAVVCVKIQCVQ